MRKPLSLLRSASRSRMPGIQRVGGKTRRSVVWSDTLVGKWQATIWTEENGERRAHVVYSGQFLYDVILAHNAAIEEFKAKGKKVLSSPIV